MEEDAGALESSSVTMMGECNLSETTDGDEVVVGEDAIGKTDDASTYNSSTPADSATSSGEFSSSDPNLEANKTSAPFEIPDSKNIFEDKALPEWVAWGVTDSSSVLPTGGNNPFDTEDGPDKVALDDMSFPLPNGSSPIAGVSLVTPSDLSDGDGSVSSNSSKGSINSVPSLFEEDVEFVGVEAQGTEKAMEHALKEGIVGEAAP